MKLSKLNRVVHRWGSILIAVPVGIVIFSGIVLQLKKESAWIQPPTQKGSTKEVTLTFDQILDAAQKVDAAAIESWEDIDRVDVRPSKGVLKVQSTNNWEVQLDSKTGDVLQVAYRRSDWIESIHDGSFFHELAKLWIFLPTAVVLAVLWGTGIYLFFQPSYAKWKRRRDKARAALRSQQSKTETV
jgi:uncharacterized iron-regulated membrane protein